MSKSALYFSIALCCLLSIVFFLFPQLDLQASAFFYQNAHFVQSQWMIDTRHIFYVVTDSLVILFVVLILISFFVVSQRRLLRPSLFLLLCFALGPGLLVNAGLKNHWGRPRPIHIVQFGGDAIFQKPWLISHQCQQNCSFVAGDPAGMFTYFAFLVFLRRKKWRYSVAAGLTALWLLMGVIRIAQGGHFLSDVLIGATLIYMVIWFSYHICYRFRMRA